MSKLQEVKARLAAYRREKQSTNITEGVQNSDKVHHNCAVSVIDEKQAVTQSTSQNLEGNHHDTEVTKTPWYVTALKVILWLLLLGFFIKVEFGLVYVVSSGLVFIILSLRGGKKRAPGELSAYSVFNKNCEAIEGTLSAEQFERELRYGPTSVR